MNHGKKGIVACDNPTAGKVGIDVLKDGGNAADAAVAVGAMLNVTQPYSCGLGGDLWILYYSKDSARVRCINGTGRSPALFDNNNLEALGVDKCVPERHIATVTVPGAVAGWYDFHERFGSNKFTMSRLLKPAMEMATVGFDIADYAAHHWANYVDTTPGLPSALDIKPKTGQPIKLPSLARAYQELIEGGKDAFYNGRIANDIHQLMIDNSGLLRGEDLSYHKSLWVTPAHADYKNVRVYETPVNSQGIVMLEALNILNDLRFDWKTDALKNGNIRSARYYNTVLNALQVGFNDFGDMWTKYGDNPLGFSQRDLLCDVITTKRSALLNPCRSLQSSAQPPGIYRSGGDTTYFTVVDKSGNAASVVYSNYMGFGTAFSPAHWGFTLHNRGYAFWDIMGRRFRGGVRPAHTLMAGIMTKPRQMTSENLVVLMEECQELPEEEAFYASFGVMGGQNQPQGHLQVALNLLEFEQSPQEALNQPRLKLNYNYAEHCVTSTDYEFEIPGMIIKDLETIYGVKVLKDGLNPVKCKYGKGIFGKGHIIKRVADETYDAGTDPRSDGVTLFVE